MCFLPFPGPVGCQHSVTYGHITPVSRARIFKSLYALFSNTCHTGRISFYLLLRDHRDNLKIFTSAKTFPGKVTFTDSDD